MASGLRPCNFNLSRFHETNPDENYRSDESHNRKPDQHPSRFWCSLFALTTIYYDNSAAFS
jgi:hypothetical protein